MRGSGQGLLRWGRLVAASAVLREEAPLLSPRTCGCFLRFTSPLSPGASLPASLRTGLGMRGREGLGFVDERLGAFFRGSCWERALQVTEPHGSGCARPAGDSAVSALGWRAQVWII